MLTLNRDRGGADVGRPGAVEEAQEAIERLMSCFVPTEEEA